MSWLRLDDMRISTGPLFGPVDDDCRWFYEQVIAADGVIYSAPIYSRTIPGKLRMLCDRVFGPHADTGFIELLMEKEAAGEPITVPFKPDERVLRPRVAGFLAVGGALTPQWHTLALPMMQTLAFSMRSGIVDQAILSGSGTPRSIVLDDAALDRARQLGRNMAQQLGRSFEEVEYRGEPGLCPLCHLSLDLGPRRGRRVRRLRRRGPRRAARRPARGRSSRPRGWRSRSCTRSRSAPTARRSSRPAARHAARGRQGRGGRRPVRRLGSPRGARGVGVTG